MRTRHVMGGLALALAMLFSGDAEATRCLPSSRTTLELEAVTVDGVEQGATAMPTALLGSRDGTASLEWTDELGVSHSIALSPVAPGDE
jgi:hypothetical protein